jgi:hypothetical protein
MTHPFLTSAPEGAPSLCLRFLQTQGPGFRLPIPPTPIHNPTGPGFHSFAIQVTLAQVIERLVSMEIDHKQAALILYALQTASMNLKRTSLEPKLPTQVVIDRQSVARRPLGASDWSSIEGREYDDLTAETDCNGNAQGETPLEKYLPSLRPADRCNEELSR